MEKKLSDLLAQQSSILKNELDNDFQKETDYILKENNHNNKNDTFSIGTYNKIEKKAHSEYFPLQTKNSKRDDFFYYETDNYKNYKYKLYNIDLDDIERKRLMGKKIQISDYNLPSNFVKRKPLNFTQNIKKNETEVFQDRIHERKNKLTMINKINKLSLELKIENSKKSLHQDKIENTHDETRNFPLINKDKNEFKKQESEKLLKNRLLGIIDKKKFELPILNVSKKNENNEIKYRKKIGGGFTLVIKKNELLKQNKIKSFDESLMKPNNPLTKINDQIRQILKSKKITKLKNVSDSRFKQKNKMNNYEEFISLSKITQDSLKLIHSGKRNIFRK